MNANSEKERVYAELDETRQKVATLRQEVKALQKATDAAENAALRREATAYRKALSNIQYRLESGWEIDGDVLLNIVKSALLLRGLKALQRESVERAHEGDPS